MKVSTLVCFCLALWLASSPIPATAGPASAAHALVVQGHAAISPASAASVGEPVLHTRGLAVAEQVSDWRSQLRMVIANPLIAYVLLLIGIAGLLFEGLSPGAIVPGVVGAITLLLALYAFQLLPVDDAGLALIGLGIVLIVAETFVPTYGSLGIGGVIAFVFGSVILMDTDVPGYGISLPLMVGISVVAVLILIGIIWLALRAQKQPVVSGREQMLGSQAEVLLDFERKGAVLAHGERWQARSDAPVHAGQRVRVTAIDGLVLEVTPWLEENVTGES